MTLPSPYHDNSVVSFSRQCFQLDIVNARMIGEYQADFQLDIVNARMIGGE